MDRTLLDNTPAVAEALDRLARDRRIPAATYRLQFNRDFTFAQAEAILDYLDDFGEA